MTKADKEKKKEYLKKTRNTSTFFTIEEIETMERLHKDYHVDKISVNYEGSGDSFDSFYSCSVDYKFLEEPGVDDLLWKVIEQTKADFNNEGSRGTITFHLDTCSISIQNYWIVQIEEESDNLTLK
jgi:hypothetical protein